MSRLALVALLLTPVASSAENKAATFGAPHTVAETVPLAEALANPEAFAGRPIVVEGVVARACRVKGCWMILKDGASEVRVTFKDYGFFVPKTLRDRRARVQGAVSRRTISVKDARHYLKDEGASKKAIQKVTAPVESVSFVATGVTLLAPAAN